MIVFVSPMTDYWPEEASCSVALVLRSFLSKWEWSNAKGLWSTCYECVNTSFKRFLTWLKFRLFFFLISRNLTKCYFIILFDYSLDFLKLHIFSLYLANFCSVFSDTYLCRRWLLTYHFSADKNTMLLFILSLSSSSKSVFLHCIRSWPITNSNILN